MRTANEDTTSLQKIYSLFGTQNGLHLFRLSRLAGGWWRGVVVIAGSWLLFVSCCGCSCYSGAISPIVRPTI